MLWQANISNTRSLQDIWKFFFCDGTDRQTDITDMRLNQPPGTVIFRHFIRKLLSKLILDFAKCPNQKMHDSEKVQFFWFRHIIPTT